VVEDVIRTPCYHFATIAHGDIQPTLDLAVDLA